VNGQTVVEYGETLIVNCKTQDFSQEAIYDDSGTDLLYYRFTVRVVGYFHGSTALPTTRIEPFVGGDAGLHHQRHRSILLQPRLPFKFRVGVVDPNDATSGVTLLQADPILSKSDKLPMKDLNNGPKPKMHDIQLIAADNVYRVVISWEVCVLECDGNVNSIGDPNPAGVLSNRWSCTDDIDRNQYTTRTFSGRLRTVTAIRNAHELRNWVLPPLQPGLQREHIQFTVTPDGLNLDYTVIDKEVAFAAPFPATTFEVLHTESIGEHGITMIGECHVTLTGNRDVNRKFLFTLAVSILDHKLSMLSGQRSRRLLHLSFVDNYKSDASSTISAHGRVQHLNQVALRDIQGGLQIGAHDFTPGLGSPPDSGWISFEDWDPNLTPGIRGNDTEGVVPYGPIPFLTAFSSALQDPCHSSRSTFANAAIPALDQVSVVQAPTEAIEARVVQELPDFVPPWIGYEHEQFLYTHWEVNSQYDTDQLRVGLPVARVKAETTTETEQLDTEPTVVMGRIGRPRSRRSMRVAGERIGKWPKLDAPENFTDINGVRHDLVHHSVVPGTIQKNPLGVDVYAVTAEFTYQLSRPLSAGEKAEIGANPWNTLRVLRTDSDELLGGWDHTG
jgi:hypothetical protein